MLLRKVNSVQEACAKCFAVHIFKFEILPTTWEKKLSKEHQILSIQFFINISSILMFFVLFCFFMRFARFQILICEPQSIWRKVLVLSLLYEICCLGFVQIHLESMDWNNFLKYWSFNMHYFLCRIKIAYSSLSLLNKHVS